MSRRFRKLLPATLGMASLLAALVVPASVAAATETFHRFEHEATANWTVVEDCGDGTTSRTLVTVIGGREFESPDLHDVNEFVTVRIRNSQTCDGEFVNDFGPGPAEFDGSASLQTASVSGTITMRSGDVVTVDVTWDATGPMETTTNTTHFPGFTGHFRGQEREAVGTGTVLVNGETLVDGSSQSGRIETLEDRNISKS